MAKCSNIPKTEDELVARTQKIAGLTLQEVAQQYGLTLSDNFQQHKGWLGQLIETVLGANAGSTSEPDFMELGIELKTIPVNAEGMPMESTFVCAVPNTITVNWKQSLVWKKLRKVLWLPIEAHKPIPERRIGQALLWQPTPAQESLLHQDWEELMDMLVLGQADQLTAKHGQVLQIRPKAAHSRVLKSALNQAGEATLIVPRGFYLRSSFTRDILASYL